jgi:ribosomal protein S18 acetylase RimI-like enzyme
MGKPYIVRRAQSGDLEELSRLWQERIAVYHKHDPRLGAHSTRLADWRSAIHTWMKRDEAAVHVADRDGQLIGYIVGWVWLQPPLFEPHKLGLVTELSVDGHCKQGGVGTQLLTSLRGWFKAQHVHHVEVRVARQQAIEQAFWRSVGAQPYLEHFYLPLDEN